MGGLVGCEEWVGGGMGGWVVGGMGLRNGRMGGWVDGWMGGFKEWADGRVS